MDINKAAPVKAQHQIVINARFEKVWQLLTEIDRWPHWNPAVVRAKLIGPLAVGTCVEWKSGGVGIVSTLQEISPMRRLGWTGKALGTQAAHVWVLEPQESAVLVTTAESFDGWLVKLFPKTMQKTLDSALMEWLRCLKMVAEKND